MLEQGRPQMTI